MKTKTKKIIITLTTVATLAILFAYNTKAAITKEISYQGKLTNTSDVAVADGNYSMVISLYTAASGGTPVWTARGTVGSPTAKTVAVASGIFSTMLGETGDNAISLDFNSTYYLGIKIGTDTEMSPRKKIGASGYAFNSDLLDGLDSATSGATAHILATDSSGNITDSGTLTVSGAGNSSFAGNVGIGTTGPGARLDVLSGNAAFSSTAKGLLNVMSNDAQAIDKGGSITLGGYSDDAASTQRIFGAVAGLKATGTTGVSSGYLSFFTNNAGSLTEYMRIKSDGNVGIGTTNPLYTLAVNGSAYAGSLVLNDRSQYQVAYIDNSSGHVGGDSGFIYKSGNVGIGTTGPGYKLDVRSTGGAYTEGIGIQGATAGDVGNIWTTSTLLNLSIGTAGTAQLTIKEGGNVGIGTTNPVGGQLQITAATSTLGLLSSQLGANGELAKIVMGATNQNYGVVSAGSESYTIGHGYLAFSTYRSATLNERVRIDSSGNVGIGTTAPGKKLDIVTATDSYGWRHTDGTVKLDSYVNTTGSSYGWLGTESAHDLRLGTGGSAAQFILTTGGNVGIGTTAPSAKFVIRQSTDDGNAGLRIEATDGYGAKLWKGGSQGSLFFNISGVDQMVLTNGGNVGIGTTNPQGLLHVYNGDIVINEAQGLSFMRESDNAKRNLIGTSVNGSYWDLNIGENTSLIKKITFSNVAGANAMVIDTTGNVGIGTTGPGAKLEINGGGIRVEGTTDPSLYFRNSGTGPAYIMTDSNNGLGFKTGASPAEKVRITTDGNVGIGTTGPGSLLHLLGTSNTYLTIGSSGANTLDRGIFFKNQAGADAGTIILVPNTIGTDSKMYFQVGGSSAGDTKMTLDDNGVAYFSGNVGIGTTSPGAKLHLAGTNTNDVPLGDILLSRYLVAGNERTSAIFHYRNTSPGTDMLVFGVTGDVNGSADNLGFANQISKARMVIQSNGNVGIGTTGPTVALDVVGQIKATGTSGNRFATFNAPTNGGYMTFEVGGTAWADIGSGLAILGTGSATDLVIGGRSTQKLLLNPNGGNVGIGTTNPATTLDVQGGSINAWSKANSVAQFIGNAGTSVEVPAFGLYAYNTDGSNAGLDIKTYKAGVMTNVMRLQSDGNVGIGTTAPGQKLDVVGGSIRTDNQFISTLATGTSPFAVTSTTVNTNLNADYLDGQHGAYYLPAGNISGTTNYISKFTGASSLGNSLLYDNGTNVGIGTTNPTSKLSVVGDLNVSTTANLGGALNGSFYDYLKAGASSAIGSDGATGSILAIGGYRASQWTGVSFHANGSEAMRINSAGNVGIGTTAPGYKLDVVGTIRSQGTLVASAYEYGLLSDGIISGTTQSNMVMGAGTVAAGTAVTDFASIRAGNTSLGSGASITNQYGIYIEAPTRGTNNFAIYSAGGTNYMSGNVGIGTTGPNALLEIKQSSNSDSKKGLRITSSANDSTMPIYFDGTSFRITTTYTSTGARKPITIDTGDAAYPLILQDVGGNVGIGTTAPGTKLTVSQSADNLGIKLFGYDDVSAKYGHIFIDGNGYSNIDASDGTYFSYGGVNKVLSYSSFWQFQDNYPITFGSSTDFRLEYDETTDDQLELADWSGNQFLAVKDQGTVADISFNVGKVFFKNDGNVGIGTTGPGSYGKLELKQTTDSNAGGFAIGNSGYSRTMRLWVDASDRSYVESGSGGVGILILNSGAGNVGVGTTNPTNKLSIDAGVNTKALTVYTAGNDGNYSAIGFQYSAALPAYGRSEIRSYISNGGAEGNLAFLVNDAGTTLTERMRIVGSTGNVGIGTTNPGTIFHINGTSGNGLKLSTGSTVVAQLQDIATNEGALRLYSGGTENVKIRSNNDSYFNGGNVGIGTTGPGYKLHVEGGSGTFSNETANVDNVVLNIGDAVHATNTKDSWMRLFGSAATTDKTFAIGNKYGDLAFTYLGTRATAPSAGTQMFMIQGSTGNVGIGITNPGNYKLYVNGNTYIAGTLQSTGAITAPTSTNTINNLIINSGALSGITTISMSGQLTSTLATGTSPFAVTSTTVNTNLNADYLDGQHGAYYLPAGNISGTTNYISKFTGASSLGNSLLYDNGTNVGIGTTAPAYALDINKSVNSYLQQIYNTNTGTSAGGLYIRSDGTGNLLTLNYAGSDMMTVSPTQTTFNNPTAFTSAGDVSLAYDLIFNNSTASYIKYQGPGYIQTESPYQNLNLTLSAANSGEVIIDDNIQITGSRLNVNGTTGYVGIGTTNPGTNLDVVASGATIRAMGTSNNDGVQYSLYHSNVSNDQIWQLKLQGSSPNTGAANKDFSIIDGSGTNYFTIKSGGAVLLQPNSGNVGIGTTLPTEKLYVYGGAISTTVGPASSAGNLLMYSTGSLGPYIAGNTDSAGNSTVTAAAMRAQFGGGGFVVGSSPSTAAGNARTFTDRFIIDTTGNVGIGTTNPGSYKLNVAGDVNATSMYLADTRYVANQIQSGYAANSEDSDIWINYTGYQGGATRFRDFRVGNGKQSQIALFDGSTSNVTFAGDLTISGDDLFMADNTANYFLMADGTNYNPTSPANARTGLGLTAGGAGDIWVEKAGDTMTGTLTSQAIAMQNYDLTGVNSFAFNDGGVNEGVSWADQAWSIDTSPLDRSNAVGNLNLYGTANNIALWRPSLWVYNASNYTTATAQSSGGLNFTNTGGHITFNPTGNVGIGTTGPGAKLDVRGAGSADIASFFDVAGASVGGTFTSEGANNVKLTFKNTSNGVVESQIGTIGNSWLNAHDGNVGIGTTAPGQKLEITGAAYASSGFYVGANSTNNLIASSSNGSGSTALYIGNKVIATTSDLHNALTITAIGSSPNANGMTLSTQVLNLEPASASYGGVVTTGTQTLAGAKTFSSAITGPTSTNTINGLIINSGALSGVTTMSMNNQLTSTLATGTSPFAVTSTTTVTNLSANLLNGYNTATAGTANTVALRDANGDLTVRYLNFTSGPTITTDGLGRINLNASSYTYVPSGVFYVEGRSHLRGGIDDDSHTVLTIAGGTSGYTYFSGNVGIGTTGPNVALDVNGEIRSRTGIFSTTGSTDINVRGDNASTHIYLKAGTGTRNDLFIQGSDGKIGIGTNAPGTAALAIMSGNVGIGTTNPGQKLEVYVASGYSARFNSGGYYTDVYNDSSWSELVTNSSMFYINKEIRVDTGLIGTYDENLSLRTSGTTRMTIQNSDGNVGIGTTSPLYAEHIYKDNSPSLFLETGPGLNKVTGIMMGAQASGNYVKGGMLYKITDASYNRGELHFILNPTADSTNASISDSKMVINYNGNVGIGETSPGSKLSVKGGMTVGNDIAYSQIAAPADGMIIKGNVGIGTTNPAVKLDVYGDLKLGARDSVNGGSISIYNPTAGSGFYLQNLANGADAHLENNNGSGYFTFTTSGEKVRITNTGNVGIGTTNPGKLLDVAGDIRTTSASYPTLWLTDTSANAVAAYFRAGTSPDGTGAGNYLLSSVPSGKGYSWSINSASKMVIDPTNGNVGIGTTSPLATLHVNKTGSNEVALFTNSDNTQPYITVGTAASTGGFVRWNTTSNTIQLGNHSFSGGGGVQVATTGNVGIGTTTPGAYKLNVAGDMFANNLYVVNTGGIYTAGTESGITVRTAGNMDFRNGTAVKMVLDTTGNVGIGTTVPGTKLEVLGGRSMFQANSETYAIGAKYLSTDGAVYFGATHSATPDAVISNGAGTSLATFQYGGNVGIGTVSPGTSNDTVALHVKGTGSSTVWRGRVIGSGDTAAVVMGELSGVATLGGHNAALNAWANLAINSGGGNVGIGTTNPGGQLAIAATADDNPKLLISGTARANIKLQTTSSGDQYSYIGFDNQAYDWEIGTRNQNGDFYINNKVLNGEATAPLVIQNGGNVGIGTTNPHYKLEVTQGDVYISRGDANPMLRFGDNDGATYASVYRERASGKLFVRSDGGQGIILDNANVGIGTTAPDGKLHVSASSGYVLRTSFGSNDTYLADSVWYMNTTNPMYVINQNGALRFGANNAEVMRLSSGNVGIGTTGPQYKVHIGSATTIPNSRNLNFNTGEIGIANFGLTIGQTADNSATTRPTYVGMVMQNNSNTDNTYAPLLGWSHQSNSGNYSDFSAGIAGQRTTQSSDSNWHGGILHFYTSDKATNGLIDRMVINDYGNVGIGTTNPTQKLEVSGNIQMGSAGKVYLNGGTTYGIGVGGVVSAAFDTIEGTGTDTLELNYYTGTDVRIGDGSGQHNLHVPSGGLSVGSDTDMAAGFGYFSGNVGIGTTNPVHKLEMFGSTTWDDTAKFASTGSSVGLEFYTSSTTRNGVVYGAGTDFGLLSADTSWAARFTDSAAEIYHPITMDSTLTVTGNATFSSAECIYNNQINSGCATAADDSDMWINYAGYNNAAAYFRDFRVGNGKQGSAIVFVDGSAGTVAFSGAVTGGTYNSQTISSAANFTGTLAVSSTVTWSGGGSANANTAYSERAQWDGGSTNLVVATGRTSLGLVAGGTGDIWVEKAGDTMTGTLTFSGAGINLNRSASATHGINWYNSAYTSWSEYMCQAGTASCGPWGNITAPSGTIVTSWALRSFIENASGYGWTWESGSSAGQPTVVAELRSSDGTFRTAGNIYAAGNVGIGTTNPAGKLEIAAGTTYGINISGTGLNQGAPTGNYDLIYTPGVRIGYLGTTATGYIASNGATSGLAFGTHDGSNWAARMTIAPSGNVGIGTTNPTNTLQAKGGTLTVSAAATYAFGTGNSNAADLTIGSDGSYAYIQSWSSKPLYLNNQGNSIYMGGSLNLGSNTITSGLINGQTISSSANFTGSLATADDITIAAGKFLNARYTGNDTYKTSLNWYGLQLGNNGDNYIIGGRTAVGGQLKFVVNNTTNFPTVDGTTALTLASTGAASFSSSITTPGYVSITGAADGSGNLRFSAANPYIYASSYFVAPGGAYFNSSTVYFASALQARGGIHNDNASVLDIQGGTSGFTNFSGGNVGIGQVAPAQILAIKERASAGAVIQFDDTDDYRLGTMGFAYTTNAIITGTSNLDMVLNNRTAANIIFGIGDAEKVRINSSGNVGIGTTGPSAKLEIKTPYETSKWAFVVNQSSSAPLTAATHDEVLIQRDDVAALKIVDIGDSNALGFSAGDGNSTISSVNTLRFFVNGSMTGNPYSGMSGTQAMHINSSTQVGIGTTSNTVYKLAIDSGTSATSYNDIGIGGHGGSSSGEEHTISSYYSNTVAANKIGTIAFRYDSTNYGSIRFQNIYKSTGNSTDVSMVINGNGYVGIGTTGPANKLEVYLPGTYNTQAIKVNDGGHTMGLAIDSAATYWGGSIYVEGTRQATFENGGLIVGTTYAGANDAPANGMLVQGNVGIGTATPLGTQHIQGTSAGATIKTLILENHGATEGSGSAIYMGYQANATTPYGIRLKQTGYPSSTYSGDFSIQTHGGSAGDAESDWDTRFFVGRAGNVGIGTTNPASKLAISGGSITLDSGNNLYLNGAAGGTLDTNWYIGKDSSHNINVSGAASGARAFQVVNASSPFNTALHVEFSGNVGIGTTAPGAKLEVKGTTYQFYYGYGTNEDVYLRSGKLNGTVYIQDSNIGDTIIGASALTVKQTTGNVGIGTTGPQQMLDINGNVEIRSQLIGGRNNAQNNFHIDSYNSGSGTRGIYLNYFTGTNAYLAGGVQISSDERLKTNIKTLDGSLNKISKLRGVTYNWKDPNKTQATQVGVIAQEIATEYPELVADDGYGYLTVNYSALTAPLIEAVREMATVIDYSKADLTKTSLSIGSDGNLGVGTTNPNYKLDVKGAINATEIRINGVNVSDQISNQQLSITTLENQLAQMNAKSENKYSRLDNLGGSFNTLRDQVAGLSNKNNFATSAEPEEVSFNKFTDNADGANTTNLADANYADNSFGGNYTGNGEYQEIRTNLNAGIDLSDYDTENGYIKFDIYLDNPDSFSDFNTEIGNAMDAQEIQWYAPSLPWLVSGWNEVKMPLSGGTKTGTVDWSDLNYFRIYFKFKAGTAVRIKNVSIVAKNVETQNFALDGNNLSLANDEEQNNAIITIGNKVGEISQQSSVIGQQLTNLENQMKLIQDQTKALVDFEIAFNLDKVIYKDAENNVNLLGGKLEADGVVAGAYAVKVNNPAAATIGTAEILPASVDVDGNGIDDNTGQPVVLSDGKTILVRTTAVGANSKVFVTADQPVKIGVTQIQPGVGFKIETDTPVSGTLKIDWWIVQTAD